MFWQAGRNFATGHPLYHDSVPGARPFKYPPLAALVFQSLAFFPLQVAAALFSLLNIVLWALAVHLTREILERSLPGRTPVRLPLLLAVVLTAQFFLDNFHHVQMNELVFVLVLLGILAYQHGRDRWAAASIVAATAIKITPIFFVAWLLIRGRRHAALTVPPLVLACVVAPLLLRKPATGAAELVEYYHVFLEPHQHGRISTYTAGQNIAALVSRMTRPGAYRYLPAPEPVAQRAYQVLWTSVLLAFLLKLFLLRWRRAPPSIVEFSLTFLAAMLLSPITFTTHLVSLLRLCHVSVGPWRYIVSRSTTGGRTAGGGHARHFPERSRSGRRYRPPGGRRLQRARLDDAGAVCGGGGPRGARGRAWCHSSHLSASALGPT